MKIVDKQIKAGSIIHLSGVVMQLVFFEVGSKKLITNI
jgi:hypothetical protein